MAALFIDLGGGPMGQPPVMPASSGEGWSIERAESLLRTLAGVVSVRVVARPGGDVEEIHLLTTQDVAPKQTVRNVESALLAHLDLSVDHRKISVAQTNAPAPASAGAPDGADRLHMGAAAGPDDLHRIVFVGHRSGSPASHRVRVEVTVSWRGERFHGEADGADLPRSRMETLANATLRAVEAAMASLTETGEAPFALAVDGIRVVDVFDRAYVLVAVMAAAGREIAHLSGSADVHAAADRAVILATLQATDRWVRGRMRKEF